MAILISKVRKLYYLAGNFYSRWVRRTQPTLQRTHLLTAQTEKLNKICIKLVCYLHNRFIYFIKLELNPIGAFFIAIYSSARTFQRKALKLKIHCSNTFKNYLYLIIKGIPLLYLKSFTWISSLKSNLSIITTTKAFFKVLAHSSSKLQLRDWQYCFVMKQTIRFDFRIASDSWLVNGLLLLTRFLSSRHILKPDFFFSFSSNFLTCSCIDQL